MSYCANLIVDDVCSKVNNVNTLISIMFYVFLYIHCQM